MKEQSDKKQLIKVKSLPEIAFLHYRGFIPIGSETINGNSKKSFALYCDTPELKKAIQEYYSAECEARKLFDSYRTVKEFLYDREF